MVSWHMPCSEAQIPGAEKAERNAASEGAISRCEAAQSLALTNTEARNAARELLGRRSPSHSYEAQTMHSHSKGQSCPFLEKGEYFRTPLLLGTCLIAFQRSETQLDDLYLGL